MLSEQDFAEREELKPKHILLYVEALVTKRFGKKIAAQREMDIYQNFL